MLHGKARSDNVVVSGMQIGEISFRNLEIPQVIIDIDEVSDEGMLRLFLNPVV